MNELLPEVRAAIDGLPYATQGACRRIALLAQDAVARECAEMARTWGNAPPNPDGRRAKLAAAIRVAFGIGGGK